MHGLPEDFDARGFVGLDLMSVTFGSNVVFFAFSDRRYLLSIHSAARYRVAGGDPLQTVRTDRPPARSSRLMALAGRRVVAVRVKPPGDLILDLDGGAELHAVDDLPGAFEVRTPLGEWCV